ncbi:MAG: hypothetical protein ABEJ73_02750 [Haloplanus sp.]
MVDPDPIGGDDPYEILGVTKMDSLGTIESQKESLIQDYQRKVKEAKRNGNNDKFKRCNEALDAIEDAGEWMEANHTPPLVDGAVSLTVPTSDIVVGAPVTVRVTDDSGPVSDAKVDVDRDAIQSKETDGNGEATFTFDTYGSARITVPTTDAYDDATETISVDRRTVDLSFRSPPSSVEVNDEVEFVVVGNGSPVSGVTVAEGNTTLGRTGSNGSVTHEFTSTGSKTITGTKSDDDTATYEQCQHDLTVSEETVQLTVRADGQNFELGDDIVVEVTEPDDTPVNDAEVSVGSESGTTNPNGRVKLPLTVGGDVTITASKSAPNEPRNYLDGDERIEVAKRQGTIRIADIEGRQMENNDLVVSVIDGAGDPLPGASVTSDWGHSVETDDDGEATIELNDYGSLHLVASKETDDVDYGEDDRTLRIDEFTRELVIDQCPKTAGPGDTIEVRVTDTSGEPISDVEVRCDRQPGKVWTTGSDGRTNLSLRNSVGVRKIWARKDEGSFNNAEDDRNVQVLG